MSWTGRASRETVVAEVACGPELGAEELDPKERIPAIFAETPKLEMMFDEMRAVGSFNVAVFCCWDNVGVERAQQPVY